MAFIHKYSTISKGNTFHQGIGGLDPIHSIKESHTVNHEIIINEFFEASEIARV